nr:immunoglobulin light chain junction region [Macaca mulatta]MOX51434.1 immunoglobulin light chain junction region [Macaca mulatta]MOX51657.1 immunoglobulin light chain junction region [Macaca mulatta]MOX51673.1 immunoglobulin light chain junction region [Macaca mulatta]MOX51729.1 immunoglobulin light chain junction region [Macaca mulatta]
CQQYNDLLFTF